MCTDFIVLTYHSKEPAAINFEAKRPALWYNENTTIRCTADGGYPVSNNISLVKNGRIISTTNDSQLTVSIAGSEAHSFGQYMCLVNNSLTTTESSILVKQKGDNTVQIRVALLFTLPMSFAVLFRYHAC